MTDTQYNIKAIKIATSYLKEFLKINSSSDNKRYLVEEISHIKEITDNDKSRLIDEIENNLLRTSILAFDVFIKSVLEAANFSLDILQENEKYITDRQVFFPRLQVTEQSSNKTVYAPLPGFFEAKSYIKYFARATPESPFADVFRLIDKSVTKDEDLPSEADLQLLISKCRQLLQEKIDKIPTSYTVGGILSV